MTPRWRTVVSTGAARGIDVDDYEPDVPGIRSVHRPEQDTPPTNKEKGER